MAVLSHTRPQRSRAVQGTLRTHREEGENGTIQAGDSGTFPMVTKLFIVPFEGFATIFALSVSLSCTHVG